MNVTLIQSYSRSTNIEFELVSVQSHPPIHSIDDAHCIPTPDIKHIHQLQFIRNSMNQYQHECLKNIDLASSYRNFYGI